MVNVLICHYVNMTGLQIFIEYLVLRYIPELLLLICITIGVKIVEKVTVNKVLVSNDRVCGVRTNQGDVKCEVFVNCAGQVLYYWFY